MSLHQTIARFAASAAFLLLAAPSEGRPLTLKAADGVSLHAEQLGSGPRGVVLVHEANRSAADWSHFAERLAANGFQVITPDLRGHGASKDAIPALDEAAWPAMVGDVQAAADWLSANGAVSVAVVGATLGANLAANAAVADEKITNLVLLSPSLNASGVRVAGALEQWTRPVLIVADAKNPAGARAATVLGEQAKQARVELLDAGATGHRMLNTVPELEALLVGWLNGATGEGAELARPDRKLDTAAPGAIETTGKAYGEAP